jgi:hypothetical protein
MRSGWGARVWRRGGYFRLLLIGYFEGIDSERQDCVATGGFADFAQIFWG